MNMIFCPRVNPKVQSVSLSENKNVVQMESSQMGNLYLKAELDELKTKHVALASKYIKLKDRTRQKLSAAKKVMEGERRIAEEIEKQMRNTLHEYESQINDGNCSRAMIEGNLNKSTEVRFLDFSRRVQLIETSGHIFSFSWRNHFEMSLKIFHLVQIVNNSWWKI